MKIRIYHNISPNASFGLNTVFERGGKRQAFTYDERHPLVWVFEYLAGDHSDEWLLADAFERFNIGEDKLAQQYRARRLRSLSVGDVAEINGRAYSCERVGWKQRQRNELRVLPAGKADEAIRQLYEFGPGEQLSISVPLPD